jgi:nucleotide-binding universal stress UspA family protein
MGFKDLLVHVDMDAAAPARIEVAAHLAAAHAAHLTAVHVMAWPAIPGYIQAELPATVVDQQRRQLLERARAAEARFRERERQAGLRAEWRVVEGDLVAMLRLHARYADLTIVGQGVDVEDGPAELAFVPEELALGVGRPILVVPRYGTFPTVGERVVIAWNGSREATRAVNDALPLLERATKVTVLSIDPKDQPESRVPGADIALHLARHGVAAEVASIEGSDIGVGDALLSRVADLGADLIVMGAYGHSRLREMVLGGATRHLLQHMTVPVLMSH